MLRPTAYLLDALLSGVIQSQLLNSFASYYNFASSPGFTADQGPWNNALSNFGTATQGVGPINQAAVLNGSSQWLQQKHNFTFNAPWSLFMWFNPAALTGTQVIVCDSTGTGTLAQVTSGGVLQFQRTSSSTLLSASGTATAAAWNSLYIGWDGSTDYCSLNGAMSATESDASLGINAELDFGSRNGLSGFFHGSLGEIQVWNRILTTSEIATLEALVPWPYTNH